MSSVDERVVEMKFNNQQFEQGASQTVSTLGRLKSALRLDGASGALSEVQNVIDKFHLGGLEAGVAGIASRFTGLGIAGVSALATITSQAVYAGEQLVKSLTIDPIKDGLNEYNTQLNAVQTILANTQASGATLKDVNKTLNELNTYSDKTIYNFSEMARNIGTFTAAGVDLKTSASAIKGIANLAALSGSSADQASSAMYQLSQAIASGKVGLMDWNSVVNAGMGGTVFKRALAQTAVAMGVLPQSALKLEGAMKNVTIYGQSFRDSISGTKGGKVWFTSKVLTNTLKILSNDLDTTQIHAMGFTNAQAVMMKNQAKMAMQAATVVKTLPQLIGTVRESVGSGWTATWQLIFGDFDQAKKLWTGVYKTLNTLVTANANARNKMLKDWQDLGGRTLIIDAIRRSWELLGEVLAPIRKAFRDIFPATTGKDLYNLSKIIDNFVESLNFTSDASEKVGRTFKGFFALLDIGRMIFVEIVKMLFRLFGVFNGGNNHILDATATMGDWIVAIDEALKKGNALGKFFTGLGNILSIPVKLLKSLVSFLGSFVQGLGKINVHDLSGTFDVIGKRLGSLLDGTKLKGVIKTIEHFLNDIMPGWNPVIKAWGTALGDLGSKFLKGFSQIKYSDILDTINTGLFGALILTIRGFGKKAGGGFFASISDMFKEVTNTLKALQDNIKSKTLITIAIALAILTASIIALSLVDPKKLGSALQAMTLMYVELGVFTKAMTTMLDVKGLAKMPLLAAAMILFGVAAIVLTTAVIMMAKLDWNQLMRGLTGLTVILGVVVGFVKLIGPSMQKKMFAAALGLRVIALSVDALTDVVIKLAKLKWEELARGMGGLVVILGALAGYTRLVNPKSMMASGLAMLVVGIGLEHLVGAITVLASLPLEKSGLGLVSLAAALLIMAKTLTMMPNNAILIGAGLYVVAQAMVVLAKAVSILSAIPLASLATGIGGLAVVMLVLAGAMKIMQTSILGAAAMVVAAAAIAILVPALASLAAIDTASLFIGIGALATTLAVLAGAMALMEVAIVGAAGLIVAAAAIALLVPPLAALSVLNMGGLFAGIGAIAAVLIILAAAGVALTAGLPGLIGLGGALVLIGVGVGIAAAGIGLLLTGLGALVVGLAALAAVGPNAGAGITSAFTAVLNLLPLFIQKLGGAIVGMAQEVVKGAPAIVAAFFAILIGMISQTARNAPVLIAQFSSMVVRILGSLTQAVPRMITSGVALILALLKGIGANIGKVSSAATDVAAKFIIGIGRNAVKLADAGAQMVINFLNGLATTIRKRAPEMQRAGLNLAAAIIEGMTSGLRLGFDTLVRAAGNIATGALNIVKNILGIHSPSKEFEKIGVNVNEGFAKGILGSRDQVDSAFNDLRDQLKTFLDGSATDITDYQSKIADMKSKVAEDTAAISRQNIRVNDAKRAQKDATAVKAAQKAYDNLTLTRKKDSYAISQNKKALDAAKKAQKDYTDVTIARHNLAVAKNAKHPDSFKIWLAQHNLDKAMASHKDTQKVVDAQHRLDESVAKYRIDVKAEAAGKAKLASAKIANKNGLAVKDALAAQQKLVDARKKDVASLAAQQAALAEQVKEQQAAQKALDELNAQIDDHQAKLDSLSDTLKDTNDQLDQQNQILDDAKKKRDDYTASIQDQYSALASFTASDPATNEQVTLSAYMDQLQQQIQDTIGFTKQLAELRARGLNDTLYKKFLSEGTDAMPFITQLLDTGTVGVNALNSLSTQLETAASNLGNTASTELYQAGVNAAQGIVDGLQAKKADLEAQMTQLADWMVNALNQRLQIQSPSRVFAQSGAHSAEGLAQGLRDSAGLVQAASSDLGDGAISALQSKMSQLGSAVSDNVDINPTIRPVLDLTGIRQGAGAIGGLLGGQSIGLAGAYSNAAIAANGYAANQEDYRTANANSQGNVTFIQNNNSPKALSQAEIYRNTRNQISIAKGALTNANRG